MFGWAFILGMIALSLMFLAGYGGMVSLVQMTVAGCAGYMVAIFGTSAIAEISLGWPWWLAVPVAILIATLFGTLSGALSVRTEGIYTIMITLAIASAFFYFTLQNYTIFNGFSGFNARARAAGLRRRLARAGAVLLPDPVLRGRSPISRSSTSRARPSASRCRARATTRAAWRRSASTSPPTASRPTPSRRVIAAVAGVLLVWHGGQISPGTAGVGPVIDILIIAVVGGMSRPIGPFIGALIYVILRTFALDALEAVGLDGKRFQLLIGLGFLLDRAVLARRRARPVGALAPATACAGSAAGRSGGVR